MAGPTETRSDPLDKVKLVLAGGLAAAALAGFYWFADASLLYRVLGLVAVAIVVVAVVYQTEPGRRAWHFAQASRTELRKVVWPTRTETTQTTLIVLAIVILIGIFLWLLDMVLQWAFGAITGIGG